ncbi:MAG: hypothetical protein V1792_24785 [Pseudomonadota bacterium]
MTVRASVEIPVGTKDPREAVETAIQSLTAAAMELGNISVTALLVTTNNHSAIHQLAERLPAEAREFSLGFNSGKMSREEAIVNLRSKRNLGLVSFSGELTLHMNTHEAFELVRSLLNLTPSAVRCTSYSLILSNVNWRGAPPNRSGGLYLLDLKAFKRKQRFSLSAWTDLEGTDPRESTIKGILRTIEQETGLRFSKAKTSVHPELAREKSEIFADHAAAVNWAFEEFFAAGANLCASEGRDWRAFKGLLTHREAVEARSTAVMRGNRARVDFPATVKRFMKEHEKGFSYSTALGDSIIFSRRFGDDLDMLVAFERSHFFGLGKSFSLQFGLRVLRGSLSGNEYFANIFRLFGHQGNTPPCWTYVTKEDLATTLEGVLQVLECTLPLYEEHVGRFFKPLPQHPRDTLPIRDRLSCKDAYSEAFAVASAWAADAYPMRVFSSSLLPLRELTGPCLTYEGFLGLCGRWEFVFFSRKRERALHVTVPYAGSIAKRELSTEPARNLWEGIPWPPPRCLPESGEAWLDSPQALAAALRNGGHEALKEAKTNFDILAHLSVSQDDIATCRWNFLFLIVTDRGREDFQVSFNALDSLGMELRTDSRYWGFGVS